MFRVTFAFVALLAGVLAAGIASADDQAGEISHAKGSSTGTIGETKQPLDLGSPVFMNEVLTTGDAARLEITFLDTTRLTLGEKASVRIDGFVYSGGKTRVLKLAAVGALRFISAGSKSAGAQVSLRTPVVVIGIRGTDFWTGPIDGQFGVLLLDGAVTVSNAAGAVVLDQPGEGTNIAGPGSAPGPVTQWPQQKVDRALAAVAF
jgi:hypothetical protein